jgi:hypothetical protein
MRKSEPNLESTRTGRIGQLFGVLLMVAAIYNAVSYSFPVDLLSSTALVFMGVINLRLGTRTVRGARWLKAQRIEIERKWQQGLDRYSN